MKIGIVSQFNNENLGNKLQNYALQQVLLDYAHEVITVINKPAAKKWGGLRQAFFAGRIPAAEQAAGKDPEGELSGIS